MATKTPTTVRTVSEIMRTHIKFHGAFASCESLSSLFLLSTVVDMMTNVLAQGNDKRETAMDVVAKCWCCGDMDWQCLRKFAMNTWRSWDAQ